MEALKTYFIKPLTAAAAVGLGAAIATWAPDILVSGAIAGQNVDNQPWQVRLETIPAVFKTPIVAYLTNTECDNIDAAFGEGVCDPDTIPFTVRFIRHADGTERSVADFYPPLFLTSRPPVPPEEP